MNTATIHVRKAFADFGVRLFAFGLDIFLLFWIAWCLVSWLPETPAVQRDLFRVTVLVCGLAYFAGAWSSPLRATPAQLLTGIRVVSRTGQPLDLRRALLRAAGLLALYLLAMFCFWAPAHPLAPLASVAAVVLVFAAAVTTNRQAGHDLLAGSIVVNRRALGESGRQAALLAHVADRDRASWNRRRPPLLAMLGNAAVFVVLLVLIQTATSAAIDMDLRARVAYAVGQTQGLQHELAAYREEHGRWPPPDAALPFEAGGRYPAGGYYELEENGRIRIRFEVKRQLIDGSILLSPRFADDVPAWRCSAAGGIEQRYLPGLCRN